MAIPIRFLYLGAAGEHYIMSECYRSNMESFTQTSPTKTTKSAQPSRRRDGQRRLIYRLLSKLPIDRGFDLAVTTAYKHFKAVEDGKNQPTPEAPIYLQVKSSSAACNEELKPGQRPRWTGKFHIKPSELSLICETSNSALACVAFVESVSDLSLARTTFAWWITSESVKELHEKNYFIKKDEETLTLNYKIVGEGTDSTHKQNTYVELMRQNASKDDLPGDLASGCMINKDCFYFHKLHPQVL